MEIPFSWTCPYCNQPTTITDNHFKEFQQYLISNSKYNSITLIGFVITCPNVECKELTISTSIYEQKHSPKIGSYFGDELFSWKLLPQSSAKPFPSSIIPQPLLTDYNEACAILTLSPKASATLSRRCLQGIIRDFWKISKDTLNKEISALKEKIDSDLWESINAIRKIGNIGAHMEKDINLIIDVEIDEAKALIDLIEILFDEWYIARDKRAKRIQKVQLIAQNKDQVRKENSNVTSESSSS